MIDNLEPLDTTGGLVNSNLPKVLRAETLDLWGSRLIEASAGTGKTWTISALYLRLILGHGGENSFVRPLLPAEILVMTFTRAATRELSDRIRARLLEAAQWFRGNKPEGASDPLLESLLLAYPHGKARDHAAWRLALAAESMDDAAVHTIDAWCQRMLREHAFDSGCLFDEELIADEVAMRVEAVHDYWRQSLYPLDKEHLEQVLDVWPTLDALDKDMKGLLGQEIGPDEGAGTLAEALDEISKQRFDALCQAKDGWAERATDMQGWLDEQTSAKKSSWDGRRLKPKDYTRWLTTLKNWANGTLPVDVPDLKTGWVRLTRSGLLEARKDGAGPIQLPAQFEEFENLKLALDKLPSTSEKLRKHAAVRVAARLLRLKRQTGTFGFADMLSRLRAALTSDNGERLRQRILAQYPVSLIDEFQDTSPVQFQIFDQIYDIEANDRQSAIFLIGDPKQSIYGFRGADIYSYMQARQATTGRHYVLQTNFRSTDALVGVVNHWFGQAESKPSEGAFMYREGAANPLPFSAVLANGRAEHLVTSQGLMPAMTLVHDMEIRNSRDSTRVFAARCAEQIVTWLNDPNAGFNAGLIELGKAGNSTRTPLRPADIAILVRTGKEADAVRRQLALRSIASVYLSDKDSVFASEVAQDLVHWLRAVASPQDARLVRAGLATRTIGLSLEELGSLASSDDVLDKYISQLRQFQTVWQTQGVLAMLRQSLHQLGLPALWLESLDGERRLTNFLHIAELLQTAAATLDGEQALIRWLQTEISSEDSQADDQIVRLESDADLIKVVTIHKSKGLEYSVVCLPFATSFREIERKNASFVSLADQEGVRTLSLNISDAELALADRERLREDLRLLYVALTRARHSLWVGFPALKVGNGKKCVSHKSGAGHLLGSDGLTTAEEWRVCLTEFANGHADIQLQNAEELTSCTALVQTVSGHALTERPNYQAEFERNWKIGSFSLLSRDLAASAPVSELSIIQKPSPADDEPDIEESAEMATPAASLKASELASAHAWHLFPKGAESGNFLHDQLEWLSAERFKLQGNGPLAQRLQRRCERAGREKHAQTVVNWLCEVVQTRLPGPNAALSELHQVLPEMEFWLPADRMEANEIDRLCRAHLLIGVERPALAERQLHGMLMGFADLVFEFEGKYWVLDYKSNHLGEDDAAYSRDKLAQSMAQHRYDVQAAIYMLALHRLLRLRLGTAYDPKTHLGGAVYLFLRGIKGPERGVCLIPASPPLMDALDAMLDDGEGDA